MRVASVALRGTATGAEAKEALAAALAAIPVPPALGLAAWPTPEYMRLRERPLNTQKLGRVMVDDMTLLANYGGRLNDGKELVVQVTAHPERTRAGDMLLTLVRWRPRDGILVAESEAVFGSDMPLDAFVRLAAARTGIAPAADAAPGAPLPVRLVKPFAWQLADPTTLWGLKWATLDAAAAAPKAEQEAGAAVESEAGAASAAAAPAPAPAPATAPTELLSKCRWPLKTGDSVLIVAASEMDAPDAIGRPAPPVVPLTTGGAGAGDGGGSVGSLAAAAAARRPEKGFKIYTKAEIAAREAAKAAEDERARAEAAERAATMAAALAARRKDADAAAAAASTAPSDGGAAPAASGTAPSAPAAPGKGISAVLTGAEAGLDRFVRLLQIGMSPDAVRQKMLLEGLDPSTLPVPL